MRSPGRATSSDQVNEHLHKVHRRNIHSLSIAAIFNRTRQGISSRQQRRRRGSKIVSVTPRHSARMYSWSPISKTSHSPLINRSITPWCQILLPSPVAIMAQSPGSIQRYRILVSINSSGHESKSRFDFSQLLPHAEQRTGTRAPRLISQSGPT